MADEKFLDLNGLTRYDTKIKEYVNEKSVTYKPFPAEFPTTGTTQNFVNTLKTLDLPVGNVYMGAASLSDFPTGISNAEIEVTVYPSTLPNTKVIYCILRSANVAPYLWTCNSFSFNGWQSMGGGNPFYLGEITDYDTDNRLDLTDMEPGTYFVGFSKGTYASTLAVKATVNDTVCRGDFRFVVQGSGKPAYGLLCITQKLSTVTPTAAGVLFGYTFCDSCEENANLIGQSRTNLRVRLGVNDVPAIDNSVGSYVSFRVVTTDKAQIITAKKTFNVLPESAVVPTTDNQLVNKKYVDDNSGMPKFNYDSADPDPDTIQFISDKISDQEDPGMFNVTTLNILDSDTSTNRDLGFGLILMKYDSTDDDIKCTFYGNGGQATFDLGTETNAETGDLELVMSNYYNLADSIGDINEVLSTLTTPSAVEQALSEI